MTASTIILAVLALFLLIAFLSTFKVVPQRSVFIVERLGKYSRTLDAGIPHPHSIHR
jgi:regulator of protease activity HflC (stomatin/prohibitin superfamily)